MIGGMWIFVWREVRTRLGEDVRTENFESIEDKGLDRSSVNTIKEFGILNSHSGI